MRICKFKQMFQSEENTLHLNNDRLDRLSKANELIKNEKAEKLGMFFVDKGHENGAEIHEVFENGVVKIYNKETCKFITVLIARPEQVERYFQAIKKEAPKKTLNICLKHQQIGLNLI